MSEADKWEVALYEYTIVIKQLRVKAIRKYGSRAKQWFGIR